LRYALTQKTINEIDCVIHRGSCVFKNSLTEKILKYVFKGPVTYFPSNFDLRSLKSLIKRGLITVDGSVYALTDYGRYVVVAGKFGIPFLSLCALSEIYVMQSNFPSPKNGSYPIPRFLEKLDTVYSTTRLRIASTVQLRKRGYVCRKSSKKVYIPYSAYLKIKQHDLILRELQKWFVETCEKIDDLVNCDPNIVVNIEKNII